MAVKPAARRSRGNPRLRAEVQLARLTEGTFSVSASRYLRRFFIRFTRHAGRHFPWRRPRISAYQMLLVEVLLRQTNAESVAKVWVMLVRAYPTPATLASARLIDLRRTLRPLGLHKQRARSLKAIARTLVRRFDGEVPDRLDQLLSIPHIGLYSASALLSFKWEQRVPIVDTNVIRVLSRLTGIALARDLRRDTRAWSLAWGLLPRRHVAQHNYGLLDFGALVCTSNSPRCATCGVLAHCKYGSGR